MPVDAPRSITIPRDSVERAEMISEMNRCFEDSDDPTAYYTGMLLRLMLEQDDSVEVFERDDFMKQVAPTCRDITAEDIKYMEQAWSGVCSSYAGPDHELYAPSAR